MSGASAPGEELIELALLFIVTGLTVVLIGAIVEVVLLREREVISSWIAVVVVGVAVCGLGVLAFRLASRLYSFVKQLR